jgi:enoyl-CoA hydratase/carnithine racemase
LVDRDAQEAKMTDTVLVDIDDKGVALITLNRPERKNALAGPMLGAFIDAMWAMEADEAVRAIVVTGAGDAFCSGLDLGEADGGPFRFGAVRDSEMPSDGAADEMRSDRVVDRIAFWRMRTPVLAAVNGAAIGAGLTLSLHADIRYVALDAKLKFPFTRLNLIPEANSTWLLPRLVGVSRALELLLSARFFSGAEAAAMGMASRALPADEVLPATLELAREIATYCGPTATGVAKQLINRALEEPDRTKVCTVETALTMWAGTLPDTGPAVMAMKKGRPPSFTGSKHAMPPAEIDPMLVLGAS